LSSTYNVLVFTNTNTDATVEGDNEEVTDPEGEPPMLMEIEDDGLNNEFVTCATKVVFW